MLTVGSLFSGIGGFDLGLERAGMRTVWFCEQDEFCQRVLAKHWPGVPVHSDVRALMADTGCVGGERRGGRGDVARAPGDAEGEGLQRQRGGDAAGDSGAGPDGEAGPLPVPVPYVDVLCGGFPCQDISLAGRGGGIEGGSRSGLWREFARLIGELRPRYVIVENVPALTSRGLDVVLSDLAACGFDAEWDHLPASAFGAPHRRDRLWLVAYPHGEGEPASTVDAGQGTGLLAADPERPGLEGLGADAGGAQEPEPRDGRALADAPRDGSARSGTQTGAEWERAREGGQRSRGTSRSSNPAAGLFGDFAGHWLVEPDMGRVAHGVPARVDRLRSLGNALVPQIAEWIGRRIVEHEQAQEDGELAA